MGGGNSAFQTFDGVLFFFGSKRSTGNSSVIMASKQCCGLTMGRARQDSIGVCCVRPMFYSIVKTRIAFGQGRHTGRQAGRSTQAQYIWLPHSCLCQTDIWKSFEMVRSGSVRKMHSDDGRMIKFIISFGSVTETCF